jgi:hypothetical membrane protein
MTNFERRASVDRFYSIAALLVPILYFGAQLAAAPFFPGYSFVRDSASMLGTTDSHHPWIFNLGAILTGCAALCGALGLTLAFRRRTNLLLAALIGLSVAATGVLSIKAGMFPMPDPRHASWSFLSWLTIASPLLFLLGLWGRRGATTIRIYLGASVALTLCLVPFLMGRAGTEMLQPGALQRLLAFAVFVPVGVVGFYVNGSTQPKRNLLVGESED